jgi:hypothetical protein
MPSFAGLCYVRLAAAVADKKNLNHASLQAVICRLMPQYAAFAEGTFSAHFWAYLASRGI